LDAQRIAIKMKLDGHIAKHEAIDEKLNWLKLRGIVQTSPYKPHPLITPS